MPLGVGNCLKTTVLESVQRSPTNPLKESSIEACFKLP